MLARQTEQQACQLARDMKTLVHWLAHVILALAGPGLVDRQGLFDFIVAELRHREHLDPPRIRPVRTAWRNSATICWHLPGCSTTSWRASHGTAMCQLLNARRKNALAAATSRFGAEQEVDSFPIAVDRAIEVSYL